MSRQVLEPGLVLHGGKIISTLVQEEKVGRGLGVVSEFQEDPTYRVYVRKGRKKFLLCEFEI